MRTSYFQALADAFNGMIYACSADHRVEFVNRQVVEQLSRDPVGERCHKALFGKDNPCPWCAGQAVAGDNRERREFRHPDSGRWYASITTPRATDRRVFFPD